MTLPSLPRLLAGIAAIGIGASAMAQQTPPDAAAPQAPAPQPTARITPQLSAPTVSPGQQVIVSYRFEDASSVGDYPRSIEVDGLSIRFAGLGRQSVFSNGRLTQFLDVRYLAEPDSEGSFTIPEQTFVMDGRTIIGEAVTITVKESGEALDESLAPQVQLSVGRTEIWKGELVPVTVTVLMHPSIQIASQLFPQITSEGFAVARFDRVPSLDLQAVGEETWRVYRAQSVMTGMKTGTLTLGPAEVKADVLMPLAGGMRDPFGGLPSTRRNLRLQSNSIEITVKDLPPGKPEGFAGAIGRFQLSGRADGPGAGPWTVAMGDPVAFELAVTGTGNFDTVNAPALESTVGFRTYPAKVAQENRGWGPEPGQKVFTQLVFPEKPGSIKAVFTLSYFDPVNARYETAKTEPLELIVTGEPPAGPGTPAVGADAMRDFATSGAAVPDEDLQDILPQLLPTGSLLPLRATVASLPAPWWHAVPGVIALALFGAGAARRAAARRGPPPPPGTPRPCREVMHDLGRRGLTTSGFYLAVGEYLRSWTAAHGRPLPADADLAAVLAERDRRLYAAGAPADAPMPPDEAERVRRVLASRLPA